MSNYNEQAAIALLPTANTHLATVVTAAAALQAALQGLEADRTLFVGYGASHVSEWYRTQAVQCVQGWTPWCPNVGGPMILNVFGPELSKPRNLSVLGEQRPLVAIDPNMH